MANCFYAISSLACLECKPGFLLDTIGACREISQTDPFEFNCILLELNGSCAKCKEHYHLRSDLMTCEYQNESNCIYQMNRFECSECTSGFYLNSQKKCTYFSSNCKETDGIHPFCLRCNDLYYLTSETNMHTTTTSFT